MKHALYVFIAVALATIASAMPPLPQEVYGTLSINGVVASPGQNVSIFDSDGVLCGSHITRHEGLYGLVSCRGDDPDSSNDEGAKNGETIFIFVNGQESGRLAWQSSRFTNLNISVEKQPISLAAMIKLPPLDEHELSLLAFILVSFVFLLICIIFLKKAIDK